MKTGLSLPLDYLAGKPHQEWTPFFGGADAFLALAKEHGVECVEIRSVTQRSDPDYVLSALDKIRGNGMHATMHGVLSEQSDAPYLPMPVVEAMVQHGERSVVTVHCVSSRDRSVDQLAEQTCRAVEAWLRWVDAGKWPVSLALELNRAKKVVDPGTDYESLVALKKRVNHPCLGFCWDFGHAANNVWQKKLPDDPPVEFLQSVIHTHIHDLGPENRTHWPLTCGVAPVARWVDMLARSGYPGVLNLELCPARFTGAVDIKDAVLKSVDILTQLL